ncbi:stage III sporulation protein SpoIIIAB [Candidatus Formimonas warabiya]|uniref:Stage III sporulation protein AB n=1 Tax=Formimonas warabiya TaxID=1761012 RepID=A0A3G1KNI2_FORW1|nr:stage III sporulation protein SpoIIIAB [Candidatus Formimonas warabiya]ATW24024.1 stage III sporulation protein AB [Candidatus Formimonas warabiya]
MLKLVGAGLVVASFGVMGTMLGKNVAKRPDELRQLQFGLQALETEIMYSATPLPQALSMVAKQTRGMIAEVFAQTGKELAQGQGQTAGEAWSKALKEIQPNLLLADGEISILEQFGQGLGTSDREDQMKRLTSIRIQLAAKEQLAETERRQYQKVWQTLGWAVGLVLTLLFL